MAWPAHRVCRSRSSARRSAGARATPKSPLASTPSARLYDSQNAYAEAEPRYRRSLGIRKRPCDPPTPTSPPPAALTRLACERQYLVGEWQVKDEQLVAAKSQLPDKRSPDAEKVLSNRLAAIDGRLKASMRGLPRTALCTRRFNFQRLVGVNRCQRLDDGSSRGPLWGLCLRRLRWHKLPRARRSQSAIPTIDKRRNN